MSSLISLLSSIVKSTEMRKSTSTKCVKTSSHHLIPQQMNIANTFVENLYRLLLCFLKLIEVMLKQHAHYIHKHFLERSFA